MTPMADDIEARWEAHLREHETHDKAHSGEHTFEREATRLHEASVDAAFKAHESTHTKDEASVQKALASVDRLAAVHAEAHEREHLAHEQRHADQSEAVAKAEGAIDRRLEGMNGVRNEMRDQAQRFASTDRIEVMQSSIDQRFESGAKHTNERYEENRRRIEALEKGDVKAEGRSIGQGATIAIIVAAIGFVGTLLGIIIAVANLATTT